MVELGDGATDDEVDEFRWRGFRDLAVSHQFSITQHGDTVCEFENLIQTVRDINHADTARLERTQNFEQAFHFIGGKACGGFIKHQHISFNRKCSRNGHERFFGAA